jgi:hypothetical protein
MTARRPRPETVHVATPWAFVVPVHVADEPSEKVTGCPGTALMVPDTTRVAE